MKTTKERIQEIKNYGYDLDFSQVFTHTFEVYKKIVLNAGLALLVFAIVMFALIIGFAVIVYGAANATKTLTNFQPGDLSSVYLVLYIVVVAVVTAIINPFFAGLLKMAHDADSRKEFSVGTAFEYYKGPKFMDLFVAALLLSLLTVSLSTGAETFQSGGIKLLAGGLNLIIGFLTMLVIPLIIFGDLKPMDAITTSIALVSKNPLTIFLLVLVVGFLVFLGIFGFCIGILFTLPMLYAMYYSIYVHAVGIEDRSEINQIGSNWE